MMTFCNQCAGAVREAIPAGDNRLRHICDDCGHIHYFNPRVITGTIPVWEGKVLLCRRNIEPQLGLWTVPAGFLELNETMAEGAARETLEESAARVQIRYLHGLYDITRIGQIYAIYVADMLDAHFETTPESSEVALFTADTLPWDELAFRVVKESLQQYFYQARPEGGAPFNW